MNTKQLATVLVGTSIDNVDVATIVLVEPEQFAKRTDYNPLSEQVLIHELIKHYFKDPYMGVYEACKIAERVLSASNIIMAQCNDEPIMSESLEIPTIKWVLSLAPTHVEMEGANL